MLIVMGLRYSTGKLAHIAKASEAVYQGFAESETLGLEAVLTSKNISIEVSTRTLAASCETSSMKAWAGLNTSPTEIDSEPLF